MEVQGDGGGCNRKLWRTHGYTVRRAGDGVHVEFLPSYLEGSLGLRNLTVANNSFAGITACGRARPGSVACKHYCTDMSCVLAHVDPEIASEVHARGNAVVA